MSHRDFCLLGLFALAVVALDTLAVPRPRAAEPRRQVAPPPAEGCPRDRGHRSAGRADGAVWCLHCDEAFYPRAAEWDAALRALAV